MHLHTSSRRASSSRLLASLSVAAALVLAACGGDETAETFDDPSGETSTPAAVGTAPAASSAPSVSTNVPDSAAPADSEAPAVTAPSGGDGSVPQDLCATIPSLEVINAVLSEPVTMAENLPRTPGEATCDVTGDGASSVAFGVLDDITREDVDTIVAELGYEVIELTDPALPGGYGYAGLAAVIVDGTQYSVQAIDLDVIMDAANPNWIQRSAELLKLWLPTLGIQP